MISNGQRCRWLLGPNDWVRAHVDDVNLVWRNTHNNTKSNANWFPVTLTDTDLNIWVIREKIIRMEILIYRWQRVDNEEQDDTTCLMSQFTYSPRISMERSRTASPSAVLQRASVTLTVRRVMPYSDYIGSPMVSCILWPLCVWWHKPIQFKHHLLFRMCNVNPLI